LCHSFASLRKLQDQTSRCSMVNKLGKKNVNRLALSETNDNSVFSTAPFSLSH
jgi:hypothetical protein